MKEISKQEIEKLIECGVIKNTKNGYVNAITGNRIGYYKTCGGHRYIEDNFCDKVKNLK